MKPDPVTLTFIKEAFLSLRLDPLNSHQVDLHLDPWNDLILEKDISETMFLHIDPSHDLE